jgi:phosphoglycolate phosphatase
MLLKAMLETSATPEATVMIGDTTYDIEMARAAGVRAIGVAWGYHSVPELTDAGAHAIVERFADLPRALDNILSVASHAA